MSRSLLLSFLVLGDLLEIGEPRQDCPVQEYETACSIGGSVTMISPINPASTVTKDNCDKFFPYQDLAAPPSVTYADAIDVSRFSTSSTYLE
jgi:hypothetical protein